MKKILTALLAAALVVSPAAAQHRNYDRDSYNRGHYQKYEHRGHRRNKDGDLILGILIGGIAGAVIADRDRYDRDDRDYRRSRYYCTTEQVVEYRYGRKYVYNVETCNY